MSSLPQEVLSPDVWRRCGRGRTAVLENVDGPSLVDLLVSVEQQVGPLVVVQQWLEREPRGSRYESHTRIVDMGSIMSALVEKGSSTFYLVSPEVTPDLIAHLDQYSDYRYFTVNGCVGVDWRGRTSEKQWEAFIVNRVINDGSGQVVSHEKYDKIYRVLMREARKRRA